MENIFKCIGALSNSINITNARVVRMSRNKFWTTLCLSAAIYCAGKTIIEQNLNIKAKENRIKVLEQEICTFKESEYSGEE